MQQVVRTIVLSAFGALMLSGFQCASADLTTARNAMRKQDWASAKTALDRALVTDSANCDALMMLADVHARQNNVPDMVQAFKRARTCTNVTPAIMNDVSIRLYNVWVVEYNAAISAYNQAGATGDTSLYTKAIGHLQTAYNVKPEYTDPLVLLGQTHEARGDTNAAMSTYTEWWNAERTGFDVAKSKSVTLGMTRQALLGGMGTPLQTKTDSTDNAIIYKDKYDVGGRVFIIFSALEGGNADAVVEGWTYAPAATLSPEEQMRSRTLSMVPLKSLAFYAYQRQQNDVALNWCNIAAAIKPSDADLGPLRTDLYARLGKTDEAINELKGLIAKDPSNVTNRIQYAGLMMAQENFTDAIAQYDEILKNEPKNETALFNMAAVYKNRAVKAQMIERAKQQADKNYKPDETYMNDLGKSAEYFVRLRGVFKYRDDLTVLEQLANIYEVRREKTKVKEIIMELEALRDKYAASAQYYQIMEGVYARNGMEDKAKEMEAKIRTMK